MKTQELTIPVPPGYIVLTRAQYDEIIEQRVASRNDRADLESEHRKELKRLQGIIESAIGEVGMLKKDLEESKAREKDTAYKLFQANETIMDLKKELGMLYDELCSTDNISEVNAECQN